MAAGGVPGQPLVLHQPPARVQPAAPEGLPAAASGPARSGSGTRTTCSWSRCRPATASWWATSPWTTRWTGSCPRPRPSSCWRSSATTPSSRSRTPGSTASGRQQARELLKESGQRAQELHALKSNFVSTISHELRTPLTALRAYPGHPARGARGRGPAGPPAPLPGHHERGDPAAGAAHRVGPRPQPLRFRGLAAGARPRGLRRASSRTPCACWRRPPRPGR